MTDERLRELRALCEAMAEAVTDYKIEAHTFSSAMADPESLLVKVTTNDDPPTVLGIPIRQGGLPPGVRFAIVGPCQTAYAMDDGTVEVVERLDLATPKQEKA